MQVTALLILKQHYLIFYCCVWNPSRVGSALGENNPHAAQTAATVCRCIQTVVSVVQSTILFTFAPDIPHIFTTDLAVISTCFKLIRILSAYVFADGLQCVMTGVLKGVGKQRICGPIVVTCYFVVALPLAYLLAFRLTSVERVLGLAIATTIGTWLHFLSYCVLLGNINWEKEAMLAQIRLAESRTISHEQKVSSSCADSLTCIDDIEIKTENRCISIDNQNFEQVAISTASEKVDLIRKQDIIPSVDSIMRAVLGNAEGDFTGWRSREYELVQQHVGSIEEDHDSAL